MLLDHAKLPKFRVQETFSAKQIQMAEYFLLTCIKKNRE